MSLLILRAYLMLIHFHIYLVREDFSGLYKLVRNTETSKRPANPDAATANLCGS